EAKVGATGCASVRGSQTLAQPVAHGTVPERTVMSLGRDTRPHESLGRCVHGFRGGPETFKASHHQLRSVPFRTVRFPGSFFTSLGAAPGAVPNERGDPRASPNEAKVHGTGRARVRGRRAPGRAGGRCAVPERSHLRGEAPSEATRRSLLPDR